MRIRKGFVSNSSSTSFTVYGIKLENEKEFEELTGIDLYKFLSDSELDDFSVGPGSWNDNFYIGLILSGEFEHSFRSDMREDETLIQFKQRVRDLLPMTIPDDMIDIFSESYYDGQEAK